MVSLEYLFYRDSSDGVIAITTFAPRLTAVQLVTADEASAISSTLCAVACIVAAIVAVI